MCEWVMQQGWSKYFSANHLKKHQVPVNRLTPFYTSFVDLIYFSVNLHTSHILALAFIYSKRSGTKYAWITFSILQEVGGAIEAFDFPDVFWIFCAKTKTWKINYAIVILNALAYSVLIIWSHNMWVCSVCMWPLVALTLTASCIKYQTYDITSH